MLVWVSAVAAFAGAPPTESGPAPEIVASGPGATSGPPVGLVVVPPGGSVSGETDKRFGPPPVVPPELPPIDAFQPSPAGQSTGTAAAGPVTAEQIAELKARRWRAIWDRVRGPLFLLILVIVFLVILVISLRKPGPTRLSSVTGRSVVLSVVIHLILLLLLDSWVISQRILQTIRDPEFEVLLDSDSLVEERISLGIREETVELPLADSTVAVAPEWAELPVPEVEPVEQDTDVVAAQPDATVFEVPVERILRPRREREAPQKALAARPAQAFRIEPPRPVLEAPKRTEAPEIPQTQGLKPTMPLSKVENLTEAEIEPERPTVDLPPTDLAPTLRTSAVESPAQQAAAPELPEQTRDARQLAARFEIEMPRMQLQVAKIESPAEAVRKPEPDKPPEPEPEPVTVPETAPAAEASPVGPAAPAVASLVALPAPMGSLDETPAVPSPPRRVIAPHPMPRPVPPPFTFEERPVIEKPYRLRRPEMRARVLEKMGGTSETEEAVQHALEWLAAHQSDDGHWDIDDFDAKCGRCGGAGRIGNQDVAGTALAVLAFLGAGHTHMHEGPYQKNVERALAWLISQAKDDGDLRGRGNMYDQGMAAIALAEAYGMTHDATLRPVVERAIDFIAKAQNPETGGWRYYPRLDSDTSVFGWEVMALKSALMAGLSVPDPVMAAAEKWLDAVGGGKHGGIYSYRKGERPSAAMAAEGMFSRQLLGRPPSHPSMGETAEYLRRYLPGTDETNFYYYYYGTLAIFQHQGPIWEEWNRAMRQVLLGSQEKSGTRRGSWAPEGRWSQESGRVVQTALATLCLEVYYRYLPLYAPLTESVVAVGGE